MTKKKDDMKQVKVDYKKVAEELALENAQLNDAMLRERADAMNVRKRADDDRLKMAGFYRATAIKELLPVIDNFERAIAAMSQEAGDKSHEELERGFQTLYKQFNQILEKLGVQRIKTTGEHFDPNMMEAVTMEEGDSDDEIVSEELQSGYKMGSELLRPAMVRVKS